MIGIINIFDFSKSKEILWKRVKFGKSGNNAKNLIGFSAPIIGLGKNYFSIEISTAFSYKPQIIDPIIIINPKR